MASLTTKWANLGTRSILLQEHVPPVGSFNSFNSRTLKAPQSSDVFSTGSFKSLGQGTVAKRAEIGNTSENYRDIYIFMEQKNNS